MLAKVNVSESLYNAKHLRWPNNTQCGPKQRKCDRIWPNFVKFHLAITKKLMTYDRLLLNEKCTLWRINSEQQQHKKQLNAIDLLKVRHFSKRNQTQASSEGVLMTSQFKLTSRYTFSEQGLFSGGLHSPKLKLFLIGQVL